MLRHQPPGRPVQRPLIVPFHSDVVTSIKPIKKRHRRTVMRGSATRLHLPRKPAEEIALDLAIQDAERCQHDEPDLHYEQGAGHPGSRFDYD